MEHIQDGSLWDKDEYRPMCLLGIGCSTDYDRLAEIRPANQTGAGVESLPWKPTLHPVAAAYGPGARTRSARNGWKRDREKSGQ
jgi:hypothetical protein